MASDDNLFNYAVNQCQKAIIRKIGIHINESKLGSHFNVEYLSTFM